MHDEMRSGLGPAELSSSVERPVGVADLPREAAGAESPATNSTLFGRGFLYVFAAAAQMAGSTLVSPVLAHVLADPAEYGALASAIALHQLLVALAVVGLDQATVLIRARDGHDRGAGPVALAAMAVALVVSAALASTARWWAPSLGFAVPSSLLTAAIVWTVPAVAIMVLLALLLGADRLRAYAIVSLVAALGGQALGIVLLVVHGPTAASYAWGVVAADVAAALAGLVLTRSAWFRVPSPAAVRAGFALGLPLLIGSLSTFVLNAGDRIVIQRMAGAAEVGRYQVAYTLGSVVIVLIGMLGTAWLPRFAEVADEGARRLLIGGSRDDLYRLLAPTVLGVALATPVALRILAPASFDRPGLLVVVVLVLSAAHPVAASGASARVLLTAGRVRPMAVATVVAAVVNIGLNVLLVPLIGIAGAAASTAAALALQALMQRNAVARGRRGEERRPWPRTPTRLLLLSVGVLLAAWVSALLPQSPVPDGIRLALGLACLPWLWICWRRVTRGAGRVSG